MRHKYAVGHFRIDAFAVIAEANPPNVLHSFQAYVHTDWRTRTCRLKRVKNNIRKNTPQQLGIAQHLHIALGMPEGNSSRLTVQVDDSFDKANQLHALDIRYRHLGERAEGRSDLVERVYL